MRKNFYIPLLNAICTSLFKKQNKLRIFIPFTTISSNELFLFLLLKHNSLPESVCFVRSLDNAFRASCLRRLYMTNIKLTKQYLDLRKGERGSYSDTCVMSAVGGIRVTTIDAVRVFSVTEDEDQESTTVPEIKTEPKVSGVPFKGFIACVYAL